jgi:hypothetical protein
VAYRSQHLSADRGAAVVPGFEDSSRRVLLGIDRLTAVPAAFNLFPYAVHAGKKFRLGVECRHYHVPLLPPFRVEAVMPGDETLDVVVGVNLRHGLSLTSPSRVVT